MEVLNFHKAPGFGKVRGLAQQPDGLDQLCLDRSPHEHTDPSRPLLTQWPLPKPTCTSNGAPCFAEPRGLARQPNGAAS